MFPQHVRGNLDNWDCLLVDGIAGEREVILLDNSGVGLSTGTVSTTVTEMARDAIAFLDAIVVERVDLLGYSLGGMVAQEITLLRPRRCAALSWLVPGHVAVIRCMAGRSISNGPRSSLICRMAN